MDIYLIGHYDYDQQESMARYAQWLTNGFQQRGWKVILLRPQPIFGRLSPGNVGISKWLGYLDKYLVFPFRIRKVKLEAIRSQRPFAFSIPDHSHGVYIKYVSDVPHIVHCHDLMAIMSAMGEIPENVTTLTGRVYQQMILKGLSKARQFICVSNETYWQLKRRIPNSKANFEIVYNGMPHPYQVLPECDIETRLLQIFATCRSMKPYECGTTIRGFEFILHVGGNQWYKNRLGVVLSFRAYLRTHEDKDLHLLMVGKPPSSQILDYVKQHKITDRVHFLTDVSNGELEALYNGAECLLFPSLMEGFGWPIIEAQSCRTPVITTNSPPMTEVGGTAAHYVSKMPTDPKEKELWAMSVADTIKLIRSLGETQRFHLERNSKQNTMRFSPEHSIEKIVDIYKRLEGVNNKLGDKAL